MEDIITKPLVDEDFEYEKLFRNSVIDECLTELSKYAFSSHSFSVLRKLQEK